MKERAIYSPPTLFVDRIFLEEIVAASVARPQSQIESFEKGYDANDDPSNSTDEIYLIDTY
jgi:hypothetical protein